MQYEIKENYMPRLLEYLNNIMKKCSKNNIAFNFKEVGEIYKRDLTCKYVNETKRYIVVDIDTNIKMNGWTFIASIDHTPDGNIIRNVSGVDVPEKYRNTKCTTCDHCGTTRIRKNTYIVKNEQGEYRQVGKSCLQLYTGIPVNKVAHIISMLDLIERITKDGFIEDGCFGFSSEIKNYNVNTILSLTLAWVEKFGYVTREHTNCTVDKIKSFYKLLVGATNDAETKQLTKELEKTNFNVNREEYSNKSKEILNWLNAQSSKSEYIYNLQMICKDDYVAIKYFGYVVSLVQMYNKAMDKQEKLQDNTSNFVGNIGDKLDMDVTDFKCVTSWDACFNGVITTTYVYSFNNNGNIFVWKTSKELNNITHIKGSIKNHNDYKGVKQTELTRCKV